MKLLTLFCMATGIVSAATTGAGAWTQCGGSGYTGSTSCASGFYCIFLSAAYSLCEPWDGVGAGGNPQPSQKPSTLQTVASPIPSATTPAAVSSGSTRSEKTKISVSSTITVTATVAGTATAKTSASATMPSAVSSAASSSAIATVASTSMLSSTVASTSAAAPTSSAGPSKSLSSSGKVSSTATAASITAVTSTSQATAQATSSASGDTEYLGRVDPSTGELTWPGTGIKFDYDGNAVLSLTVTGVNNGELIIDGQSTDIPSVTTDIPLPSGSHSVEFRKKSEALYGSIFVQEDALSASTGERIIEFIGDSITAGYGLDGTGPCAATAQNEDSSETYAALTADLLEAEYNIIAWSGKGLTRNYPGDDGPLMPELWTRYGANDADNSYTFPVQAQVVVINLGTNDFVASQRDPLDLNAYQNAMTAFIGTVQSKYPKASFFLMSSPMLADTAGMGNDQHTQMSTALQNAAASADAHFVDWPTQGSATGCAYHPNADTHRAEASVLASTIQNVMGW